MQERIAEVINLLLEADEPLTGMQLAQLVQVSPRTITNDLHNAKTMLAEYGYDLISKRGTGYYLDISAEEADALRERLGICGNGQSMQQMRLLEGEPIAPARVEVLSGQGEKAVLQVTIHQG